MLSAPAPTPAPTASSKDKVVLPGAEVPCSVQSAQDFDTYTSSSRDGIQTKSYAADGPLTYRWSASAGHFKDDAETGQNVTWVAPDDLSEATSVIIKCIIDDPDGPRVSAPDTGSHDDNATVRMATVIVKAPTVEFTGNELVNQKLRACAGGIDDHAATNPDGAEDFQYRAHTRKIDFTAKLDGKAMPNARFTLRFDGNKGHEYGDGREKKMARLHKTSEAFDAANPWKETLEVQADSAGKVSVWVLSSDVIGKPVLQAILKPVAVPKEPLKLGEISCDFDAPTRYRRFDNPFDQEEQEDRGWIFDFPRLIDPDSKEKLTPAKLYLKFKKFENKGDDYTFDDANGVTQGNWQFVNGHDVKLFIAQVDLLLESEDETSQEERQITGTPEFLRQYAFVNLERTASQDCVAQRQTAIKGETLPQVYVKAGTDIKKVKTVWVDAQDLCVWEN